ncbi:MAG: class I adenylate-forming enzyme family protein [Pseudomonadota bacterium]
MSQNIARIALSYATTPQAIVLSDEDREIRRGELFGLVKSRIEQFANAGVGHGEFVVVNCNRGLAFWIDLLSLWGLGARPVCLESDIDPAHAKNVAELSEPRRIAAGEGDKIPDVFADLERLPEIDWTAPEATINDIGLNEALDPHEVAGLIFTSGTTGLPKGVPLTHWALSQNALGTATRLSLRPGDRLMIATPFRFISSISHFLVTLMSGAEFFGTERKLMAADLVGLLRDRNMTAFGGSPFHARMISMADAQQLPRLRWLMSSGDHLPKEVIDELQKNYPSIAIHTVYGMAELGGRFCTLAPEFLPEKAGSVGLPIPGLNLEVRDEDGKSCKTGEIGSIFAGGSFSFSGYYKNEEANRSVLGENGFRTGDMGYWDKDGFLYLAGRSDSVFKRSGLKVSALTITDAILSLGLFEDVIVLSKEDPIEGAAPVAYVSGGHESVTKGQLLRELRPLLPGNHLPKELIRVPEIPRTGSGKVDRRKLKDMLKAR